MPDRFVSPSVSSSSFSKLCLPRRGTALGDLLPTIGIVILMLLVAGFDVASAAGRKGGKPSVFSLFNLKAKSKFWSEKVIRGDFDDLESSVLSDPGKMGAFNYTRAGNIANFLELSEVDSLYIPVPVNFVFIGFDGKGNHNFKLVPEELERWFTKIDHVFEHTRIPPIGEVLNPFYKISIDKAQHHHLPLVSHINYNFSVHAIQMGEKVTSIFEHAIKVFSRVDDISGARDNETLLWQVDIDMMDYLFSSLVDYLQLQDAYNIFILNPRHDAKKGKYGYRRGLSESEINLLRTDRTLQAKVLQPDTKVEGLFEFDRNKIRKPLYKTHPMSTFAWTEAEEIDTSEWSRMCLDALSKVENVLQWKDHSEITYTKVSQILHGKIDHMRLLFEKGLKSGDVAGLHSECLTDTWIGRDRWACIDLSAGPFSWGPAVGGEGVRTELSLPSVGKTIGAVAEITEEEAEDRLQDTIRERFSVFGDDHQAIDILLAEIDIYELFAFKHCKGRKVKLALCEELDERMRDLKNELQAYDGEEHDDSHKKKAVDALKRMENWNLFSDAYEDFHNYTVARDSFLAHLGATLWGSMRHVIAPSFADGAYHYYETISFQLFFITQEKVRNVKQLPVNLKALEEGLSSLLVSPSQKVMFSPQLLMLSEDPALTMAFSVARRAAAVPMLLVNGTYRSTIRSYLDSSVLQHQLQTLSGHAFLKGRHSNSRTTLEVPIFWFIHSDSLFVDKYYQTKALSDMIIVVQSDSSSWESHLQCNGQSILWDLRIPIKAAVSAAAEHLAGLLPLHLIYNQAHETAIEDWIWSVGCSPLSVTSHGWQISHFQTDSLARSYIFTSLEESIQIVNEAIHLLLMERTTEQGFKVFKSQERVLVEKYNSIVSSWRRISTSLGDLHYSDAVRFLSMLDEATKGFKDSVNSTIALLHPIHCTQERKIDVEVDMTTIPAFLVVGAILWFVLRPRRPKAKIN